MQQSEENKGGNTHIKNSKRKRILVALALALLLLLLVLFFTGYLGLQNSSNKTPKPQVTPPSLLQDTLMTSTGTVYNGSLTVVHTETGVKVTLQGPSLPEGSEINISSIYYGHSEPQSTNIAAFPGLAYYDVKVTLANGSALGSDVHATVYISNPNFVRVCSISYWNNSNWKPVDTQTVESATLCGEFPASELSGTLIGISGLLDYFIMPEYAWGSLMGLLSCFGAFAVTMLRKNHRSS